MAQYFAIHPTHPQLRLIAQAAQIVQAGGVIAYPTDSCYAFGCHLGDKDAVERLRRIRGIDDKHHLTLVCGDLSAVAQFARIDNARFRLLKQLLPGSYTFILEATREIPRRALNAKRKTIGIRVPSHPVTLALLRELGEPLLSASAILPGEDSALAEATDIRAKLEHQLALVMDAGACGTVPTTVIDLTGERAVIIREGAGPINPAIFVD